MDNSHNPCYCEQAKEYEMLLEEAYPFLVDFLRYRQSNLAERIRNTIDQYKKAQQEYEKK